MKYFGYIRVSTVRQGEHGVSLQEQRDAITRYAQRQALQIAKWFEERETAAKRGRPVFNQMLRLLKKREAAGVVIHKIDRGARNMRDWADLVDLFDSYGIEVHCANEGLDFHTRGGRLSADIQAVVAADYIRNLREETRKGFYGRLKQGLYPLPAPLGYVDRGKGKVKDVDPVRAPLVKRAFELYATGRYSLERLRVELEQLGLRNRHDGRISENGLSIMLNNVFYIGLIRLKRTNETFTGSHPPLIAKSLYDRVQQVLRGHVNARVQSHDFQFRRLFFCAYCNYALTGERQKGHVYYRCHTKNCQTRAVREEAIAQKIESILQALCFQEEEWDAIRQVIANISVHDRETEQDQLAAQQLRLAQLQDRVNRLTDAYIDRLIERDIFEERKTALLMERKQIEEHLGGSNEPLPERLTKFFERANSACLLYKSSLPYEKRDALTNLTSNRTVAGKNVVITLAPPYNQIANRPHFAYSSPKRARLRTVNTLIGKVRKWVADHKEEIESCADT